ncbi:hypothetical protein ACFLW9_03295 [Chloroflexota bacterium]
MTTEIVKENKIKTTGLEPFTDALQQASNLNVNQAKTLLYYCIMTWSDEPKIRPIIDLNGESGSGKNTIMKQILPWCSEAKWINARNMTSAQLRDELADTMTAFVEEADKTTEPKVSENWYQYRYEETGRNTTYRRQIVTRRQTSIYQQEKHNHFGYTILHTQNPFQSTEMDRRILRISLVKDISIKYKSTELDSSILVEISFVVDWSKQFKEALSNSAWDVWLPVMRVADCLGDSEFLKYAEEQIGAKTEEDELSKLYEPKGVVLSEIAQMYEACLKGNINRIAITDIRHNIQDRGYVLNERQIAKLARELGFTIKKPKNKAFIKVICEEELRKIFENAGVSQNFDDESDESEGGVIMHSALAQG